MSVSSLGADSPLYLQNYKCGDHKQHTSDYFQKNLGSRWHFSYEKVLDAVQICPLAIRYSKFLQHEPSIAEKAVKKDGLAFHWFSDAIRENKKLAAIANENLLKGRKGQSSGSPRFFLESQFNKEHSVFDSVNKYLVTKPQPFTLENADHSVFIRDSAVTLPDRSHLLPYPIKKAQSKGIPSHHYNLFNENLIAMLPLTASHFLLTKTGECDFSTLNGKGFQLENIEQAMVLAHDYDLSYILGKTTIEGGNCFIFSSKGERKALVGEISLYLSMMALEEQNAFDNIQPLEPSEESYRMARNLDLYKEFLSLYEEKMKHTEAFKSSEEVAYRKHLLAPITPEEKVKYHAEAEKIEAKLRATKEMIAKELGLANENVIYLPQTEFHIDMSMTVTPDGTVVLYDPETTLNFLDELLSEKKLSADQYNLYLEYISETHKEIASHQAVINTTKEALHAAGIDFVLMPAVLKDQKKTSALNYCNGLFVEKAKKEKDTHSTSTTKSKKKYAFFTTGPSVETERPFHEKFTKLFEATFPNYSLVGIEGMSSFVAESEAGIHCMTMEEELLS